MNTKKGCVTVPTDVDVVEETLNIIERWEADVIRDCDGISTLGQLRELDVKQYATYYMTKKDNTWVSANPQEIQQMYLMSDTVTASAQTLTIPLMKHYYKGQLKVNILDNIKRWWEVTDRMSGDVVAVDKWEYDTKKKAVVVLERVSFYTYTVSSLTFVIWDPVYMYNALTNEWEHEEHQMTYDVWQSKTQAYVLDKLRRWIAEHPEVDVIRFTTFFHQFMFMFDEQAREKFVGQSGYSANVSPYILEQFKQEVGYRSHPEYITNQGYHNSASCVLTKEYRDFMDFQMREAVRLVKKLADITHEAGKEAMMFLGDHRVGTEPFGSYFQKLGLGAVMGSVGDGRISRLISDIRGVKCTEGRFLPYFLPDVLHEDGDPVQEAKVNWVTARRAILCSSPDHIEYGGYLKFALKSPDSVDYIEEVCNEFCELYEHVYSAQSMCMPFKVTILNSWRALRG